LKHHLWENGAETHAGKSELQAAEMLIECSSRQVFVRKRLEGQGSLIDNGSLQIVRVAQ
jgi:hypothetical protein